MHIQVGLYNQCKTRQQLCDKHMMFVSRSTLYYAQLSFFRSLCNLCSLSIPFTSIYEIYIIVLSGSHQDIPKSSTR